METFDREELVMLYKLALQHVNIYRQNSDCIDLMNKIQRIIRQYDGVQI